ncbi:MAG TPA: hypothetical protein VGF53_07180 [Pseudolabrys sp.]
MTAHSQGNSNPLPAMQGRWIWIGSIEKSGKEKACAENWTEFSVSADQHEVTYRYPSDKDGKHEIKSGTYNVLYQEENKIAMFLNGENRRLNTGDRYIWVAIIETSDRFLWRVYGASSTPEELAKFARVRCP